MKMKIQHTISVLALAFICAGLSAQNLNPTVSVSREYEGKLMEVSKPSVKMAVPDSLTEFNLKFDYSVFENPYKGSYDFKPYNMDMRPDAEPYSGRKFYLKAGAGWQLRPEFDLVWEPSIGKRFKMDVYATHHSFIGNYKEISYDGKNLGKTDGKWKGYNMDTRAGVRGSADLNTADIDFSLGYTGLHTKDFLSANGYNAADLHFRVNSDNPSSTHFYYDAALDFRYGVQGLGELEELQAAPASALRTNDIDFKGTFGTVVRDHSHFLIDLGIGVSAYSALFEETDAIFSIIPKYVYRRGIANITVGAEVALKKSSKDSFQEFELHNAKGQIIYPDVHVNLAIVRDYLNFQAFATGGIDRNTYSSLKETNHFFNPYYGRSHSALLNNTIEKYNVGGGFNGNIAGRFLYDVKLGYARYKNAIVDALQLVYADTELLTVLPGIDYRDYGAFCTDLRFGWESRSVSVDSHFRIMTTDIDKDEARCFEPAFFSGDFRAMYNYRRRVYAGITADFASRRRGHTVSYNTLGSQMTSHLAYIPLYVNLGVEAEYAITRKFSVWLRGDNLLNMNVQRFPCYNAGGIGVTAGIILNL
ncbi:MAG: hypothetical protein ACI4UJ_09590 [Candidatus Cryptobacteroides sp.]